MDLMWDFLVFSEMQLSIGDSDGHHPAIRHLSAGLSEEEAIWLTLLYMAYYNEASAYTAFHETGRIMQPRKRYPIDVQRRNLRPGDHFQKHLAHLLLMRRKYGTLKGWLTHRFGDDPRHNWRLLIATLESVAGNGRWAAFTTAEFFHKNHAFFVTPTDIGVTGASGPMIGIRALFGEGPDAFYDQKAKWLLEVMPQYIDPWVPYLPKGTWDYAMLESILCDWAGMVKGTFYVGRNIDRMQHRILKVEALDYGVDTVPLWEMRKQIFNNAYLGELHGWVGIDSDRLKAYQDSWKLLWPNQHR